MVCIEHASAARAVISLGDLNAGAFASGFEDGAIRAWASDGTLVRAVEARDGIISLALSPCSRRVAAGCGIGSVKVYGLPGWDLEWSVKELLQNGWSVSWSLDGSFLVSGSGNEKVKVMSADTGATLRTLRGHTSWVMSVCLSRDGTKVLSGSWDKTVRVWRIFWGDERRVMGLMGGLEVLEGDWGMREVCREIVRRMKRLWEVEAE